MGSKKNRGRETVLRALDHPIRIRICELSLREPSRVLTASDLKETLAREFKDLEVRQVAYHLAQLQDADLLPRPIRGNRKC